ncbi:MAG: TRAP transporter substrate-binding protein DctP [Paracoccaceae bacterium]
MTELTRRAFTASALALGTTTLAAPLIAQNRVSLRVASFSAGVMNEFVIQPWIERVVADSEGTLDYQFFPGGVLGRNPGEQLKLIQDGVADIAFTVPDFTPGDLPSWSVYGMPNLFRNAAEGALTLRRAFDAGLLEQPEGVEMIAILGSAPNRIHSARPISSLDDLAGLRIQAGNRLQLEGIARLGASPVAEVRGPEAAEAISRGTIDAATMDYAATRSFRVGEVTRHHLDLPMGGLSLAFPINSNTWNSLPDAARAAFQKHSFEAFSRSAGETLDAADTRIRAEQLALPDANAMEITEAVRDDFAARLGDIETVWIDGNPGRQATYDGVLQILNEIRAG